MFRVWKHHGARSELSCQQRRHRRDRGRGVLTGLRNGSEIANENTRYAVSVWNLHERDGYELGGLGVKTGGVAAPPVLASHGHGRANRGSVYVMHDVHHERGDELAEFRIGGLVFRRRFRFRFRLRRRRRRRVPGTVVNRIEVVVALPRSRSAVRIRRRRPPPRRTPHVIKGSINNRRYLRPPRRPLSFHVLHFPVADENDARRGVFISVFVHKRFEPIRGVFPPRPFHVSGERFQGTVSVISGVAPLPRGRGVTRERKLRSTRVRLARRSFRRLAPCVV
mmetsp:Transcript_13986/g.52443  ORF Transcript_13986/g.52443 Transcript_13986/m.52443 type:complete len:280 (+) Transcript_13986:1534-2373(+)